MKNQKYTDTERQAIEVHRKKLLELSREAGVGIVHIRNETQFGGMTIAYKKTTEYASGIMVEVAVATCSPKDVFSRKMGTHMALGAFFDGRTVQLPLLMGPSSTPEDLSYIIKNVFSNLLDSITY